MNNGRANVIFIDKLECENVALLTYVTFGWILDPHLHSIEGFRIPDSVEFVSCFLFFVSFFVSKGGLGLCRGLLHSQVEVASHFKDTLQVFNNLDGQLDIRLASIAHCHLNFQREIKVSNLREKKI